jgi:hypothetical protein
LGLNNRSAAEGNRVKWINRRSLIASVGFVAVLGAAYVIGRAHLHGLIGIGSLAAIGLSLIAIFQPRTAERIAGTTLLVWVVLATLTEQFAWAASSHGILIAAAWLVPPIAGGVVLTSAGHWWSGLGCWAASFAGVAATTYSVHSVHSGAGLIQLWRS